MGLEDLTGRRCNEVPAQQASAVKFGCEKIGHASAMG